MRVFRAELLPDSVSLLALWDVPQPGMLTGPADALQTVPAAAQAATCDYWFHVRPPPTVQRVDRVNGNLLPMRGFKANNQTLLQDVPSWR